MHRCCREWHSSTLFQHSSRGGVQGEGVFVAIVHGKEKGRILRCAQHDTTGGLCLTPVMLRRRRKASALLGGEGAGDGAAGGHGEGGALQDGEAGGGGEAVVALACVFAAPAARVRPVAERGRLVATGGGG